MSPRPSLPDPSGRRAAPGGQRGRAVVTPDGDTASPGWRTAVHAGITLALLAVAVLLLRVLSPAEFRNSFTRAPIHYTSLAFVDPDSLIGIPPDAPVISFSFVLTNQEGRDTTYRYLVRIVAGGQESRAAEGEISVPAGGTATTPVALSGLPVGRDYSLVVSLLDRTESISLLRSQNFRVF